jgi:hypothetical protein
MIFENVLASLIANIIFWFVLGVFVWFFHVTPIRMKFERFFGINKKRQIDIFLSNLWDSSLQNDQHGEVIAGKELEAAKTINSIFACASPGVPELVRGLVGNIWTRDKYSVRIQTCPEEFNSRIPENSMIVIGATTKNSIRRFYDREDLLLVKIDGEPIEHPIDIYKNTLNNVFKIKREHNFSEYNIEKACRPALIERLVVDDTETNSRKVVFMCVGRGSTESKIAATYLANNCRKIAKAHKDAENFAQCLSIDPEGNVIHSVPIV